MNQHWLRSVLSVAAVLAALNFISCGHQRKLVSIDVRPTGAIFATPNPAGLIDFTALGTYRHPPDTRDITDRVTWKTDNPQLILVTKGVVSPQSGNVCGVGDIPASYNGGGNLIVAYADDNREQSCRPSLSGW